MSNFNVSLLDKKVLVTGSRRGMGEAIALAFAESGADVAVTDLVVEDGALDNVAGKILNLGRRTSVFQCDISKNSDVRDMVRKVQNQFSVIDILVNVVGVVNYGSLFQTDENDWDRIMNTNLKAFFLCCRAVMPDMIERRTGIIINIASIAGMKIIRNVQAYGISKAGVIILTKTLAQELASYNVRVNGIAPGTIRSEMNRKYWETQEALKQRESIIPIGRIGETRDIANVALFLASDAASYITGQTIVVDGGMADYGW